MDQNELPLEPRHLVVPTGASKTISEPMVCLAQITHLSCTDINTDEDITCPDTTTMATFDSQLKQSFTINVFDTFDELMLHHDVCSLSFSKIQQFYIKHYLPTDRNEIPLEPRHLGVSSGASKIISEPCSAQTVYLSCVNISTISKPTETSFHLSLVTYGYHQVRPK